MASMSPRDLTADPPLEIPYQAEIKILSDFKLAQGALKSRPDRFRQTSRMVAAPTA